MSQNLLRKLIKETIESMEAGTNLESPFQDFDSSPLWDTNTGVSRKIASFLPETEAQGSPVNRGNQLLFRHKMKNLPSSDDLRIAVGKALNYDPKMIDVSAFVKNTVFSGKYLTSIINVKDIDENTIHKFGITAITSDKKSQIGGTSGPGEDELIEAIKSSGASMANPINIVFGKKTMKEVTGAIKPARSDAKGGEPKIDVLILGKNGRAHDEGGLSLKLSTGTPSYDGWKRITQYVDRSDTEFQEIVDRYIQKTGAKQISKDEYEYSGNIAFPTSDKVAFFSIYGNEKTSGGLRYGKKNADYVVTVSENLSFEMVGDTLYVTGYEFHERHSIFRGTKWEPYWLVRGSRDRSSGDKKKILNSRILVAPEQRAKGLIDNEM